MPDQQFSSMPSQDAQQDQYASTQRDSGAFADQVRSSYTPVSVPRISLPKGGGAIKGIDEKFEINTANGTATCSIPIPTTASRNGAQPMLSLQYNSGAGNDAFGLGWSLALPFIQRRTDKRLPEYKDQEESDVFIISGAEDMIPYLEQDQEGRWEPVIHHVDGLTIKRYRPRIEGAFSRIERIEHPHLGMYWKVTDTSNIVTLYGNEPAARIADPYDEQKIFRWLPTLTYTDRGDWIKYSYVEENLDNVPDVLPERNRLNGKAKITNRYLKRVQYGNRHPWYPAEHHGYSPYDTVPPPSGDHLFEIVLDYGEHETETPTPEPAPGKKWNCRSDPFSDYHAGFEIRTYRLCKRFLLFHLFEELGSTPTLVHALELTYQHTSKARPEELLETSYLRSATLKGYVLTTSGYLEKALPPLEFGYQELRWHTAVHTVTPENIANAPTGLTNNAQWLDLYGEGISGIFTEESEGWYYKFNEGAGNFTHPVLISPKPSFTGFNIGALQVEDLNANGFKQVVSRLPGMQGYFNLQDNNQWATLETFEQMPTINFQDPYLRMIDLDGDGRPDLLITEETIFRWYPSLGTRGYAPLNVVSLAPDEETSPRIVFADPEQTIFLADMSGDGLTDIVRIRNGAICYWPNLGFGRFGARVNMGNAPWMDNPDLFNPAYIHLADISGTGATDLIYLGKDKFRAWLNISGNTWSEPCEIDPFWPTSLPNDLAVVDLLGAGTSCIAWSSPLPSNAQAPLQYIDLMGGKKPHVLNYYTNHCGKETRLTYTSSTKFYLEDKKKGQPWITKLPFPVQCVSRQEVWEKVSNTYFVNEFSYHHGYFDHIEREYRGFGRVDQLDTQRFESLQKKDSTNNTDASLNEPPVLTRTWFHLGAYFQNKRLLEHYKHEYWYNNPIVQRQYPRETHAEYGLPDALYIGRLDEKELIEAHRACKGMILRQEIFALDGSNKEALPYAVATHNCHIKLLQPLDGNRYAVFLPQESESISFSYERNVADPRVTHTLNLQIDDLGNILKRASVVYPRRHRPHDLTQDTIWQEQHRRHLVLNCNSFTNDVISPETYRLRSPFEAKVYELSGIDPEPGCEYYTLADFDGPFAELGFDQPFNAGRREQRKLSHSKILYLDNGLEHPLPEGRQDTLGLAYQSYALILTPAMIDRLYHRDGQPLIKDHAKARADGRYIDLQGNGEWWIGSGRTLFEPLTKTRAMFYQPRGFEDPFGTRTTVRYYKEDGPEKDRYFLLLDETIDALGNKTRIERFNFRNLQPEKIKDINGNRAEVLFDELGLLVATALQGKQDQHEGDRIDDTVRPFLSASEIRSFFDDPFHDGPDVYEKGQKLLGNATTRLVYDYSRIPISVATIARETHVSALAPDEHSRLQYGFEYTGGMGNLVLKKVQAAPGGAWSKDQHDKLIWKEYVPHRWIGNGRTVLNNKGKPVKQYEPYFSATSRCEKEDLAEQFGVTPIIHYDALGRVIRTDLPDGTITETCFDNWRQQIFDANDTVLASRWYRERIGGDFHDQGKDSQLEKTAAERSAVFAGTCSTVYLDSLGRSFVTRIFNKWQRTGLLDAGERHSYSRIVLDIQGNKLEAIDARHNTVMRFAYDMRGGALYQDSMDAGRRWILNNCLSAPDYAWDDRDQRFHTEYDLLHRPIKDTVATSFYAPGEHPRKELVINRTFYGGNDAASLAANLNGRPVTEYDSGGVVHTILVDFKGNILQSGRQLCKEYRQVPNWHSATITDPGLPMEPESYSAYSEFDALNRPIKLTSPSAEIDKANIFYPAYDQGNRLKGLKTRLRRPGPEGTTAGEEDATLFVKHIAYDEKGLRTRIVYGNDTATNYRYDRENFNLLEFKTRAKDAPPEEFLQSLAYTYDAAGNITHIHDGAWQPVYFRNKVVNPSNDYIYDAMYRLIEAHGREFAAQNQPVGQYDGERRVTENIPFHNNQELRAYTQSYAYDVVGNMLTLLHKAPEGGGWTREFGYQQHSNRLTGTRLSSTPHWEHYQYDRHGNMLNIDAARDIFWDYKNQLMHMDLVASKDKNPEQQAWYVYDGSGQRIRKIVQKKHLREETIYLGGFEIYREYTGETTAINKQRETLHVMDDIRRIALVETLTIAPEQEDEPSQLIRYQFSNHLGSSSLELDEKGKIISYEEYYPYGSSSFQLSNKALHAAHKRYRYSGMERDAESGLNYQGARYYAPWLARWTASDPSGIKHGLNTYEFVNSNPPNNVDLNGKFSFKWKHALLGAGIAVISVAAIAITAGAATPAVAAFIGVSEGALAGSLAVVGTGVGVVTTYQSTTTIQQEIRTGKDPLTGKDVSDEQISEQIGSTTIGALATAFGARGIKFNGGGPPSVGELATEMVPDVIDGDVGVLPSPNPSPNFNIPDIPLVDSVVADPVTGGVAISAIVPSILNMTAFGGGGGGGGGTSSGGEPNSSESTSSDETSKAPDSTESSSPTSSDTSDPFEGLSDEEIEQAVCAEPETLGSRQELTSHADASYNRSQLGVSGKDVQSAHMAPQSAMRNTPGYNPRAALTSLQDTAVHTSIDAYWKSTFQSLAATGKTEITAQELFDTVAKSIELGEGLSDADKSSLTARLSDELFIEYGLTPQSNVRLPYSKK